MPAIPRQAFAAAFVALLLPNQSPATTVPCLDLPELVHGSERIVHARVVRHWSDWDAAHRIIWTHYLLDVKDSLKGHSSPDVRISEPGGTAGETMMKVEGVTEYYDGEEVVVFLHRTPIGYWRCYGWGQGKYSVTQAAGGPKRIRTNLSGLAFIDRPGPSGPLRPAANLPLNRLDGMTLQEFEQLVLREANR